MSELFLTFTPPPGAELIATRFTHSRLKGEVSARLGAYDRAFRGPAGGQALTALLLRTAAWGRRNGGGGHRSPPCLEGHRPSPAASLNDVLTSRPQWVSDVFGEANGRPVLTALIGRWNADFNTCPKAPVRVWVECDELPPGQIHVQIEEREVRDARILAELAE